jgi:hypothetical protein
MLMASEITPRVAPQPARRSLRSGAKPLGTLFFREDNTMKRRDYLSSSLALAWAGLLAGCGGGGSSPSTPTDPDPSAPQGRVNLPTGMSTAGMAVRTLQGSQTVRSDGSFPLVIEAGGPSLAVATGAGGKPLLYGFARAERPDLSVRTTAEVLAFVACGGVCLPGVMQPVLVAELGRANLSRLEAALTQLLITHGEGWLDAPDAALKTALIEDTKPFRVASPVARASAPGRVRPLAAVVTPTDRVSGITVESDGLGTTVATNYFRRRAYVFAERISYVDSTGATRASAANLTPQPIALSPVKSATSALPVFSDYLAGVGDFFLPVKGDPIACALTPGDARSTLYRVTAVGLGPFAGAFDELTPEQQEYWLDAALRSLVIDLIIPFVTGLVIPLNGAKIDRFLGDLNNTNGFVKDIISALAAQPDIIAKAKAGNNSEAGWDGVLVLLGSETLKIGLLQALWAFLDLRDISQGIFMVEAFEKMNGILTAVDLGLQATDTIFQLMDLGRSERASQWDVVVTPAKLELTPKAASVTVATTADFAVRVLDSGIDSGLVTYRWSVAIGTLTNTTNGATGTQLDTSAGSIRYRAPNTVTDNEKTTLTVEAFLGGVNDPNRRSLGTASAALTLRSVPIYGEADVALSDVVIPSDPRNRHPIEFVGGNWTRSSPVPLGSFFGTPICQPGFDGPGGVGLFGLRTGIAFDFAMPVEAGKVYPLQLNTAHNYLAFKWTTSGNVHTLTIYEGSVSVIAVEGKRISFTLTARCSDSGTPATNPADYAATVTASGWFLLA